ncbi:hypothetical protein TIFTF001_024991 [Ficus carica]|uniref:F-box domain-containing protein n=1 Tax=Ficus carica TaxID=3494 RepID=A0AA88DKH1_FICCA|nr:hypothetical protein TIFTF001_024991 [Ficus carica]
MGSHPAEILMPILCQQHVKDLLRYKSTCKLWYSLMDDPDFIKMHFHHHSVLETTSCVIVTRNNSDIRMSGDNHFFWVDDIHAPKQAVRLTNPLIGETLVLGSCNGLLALHSKRDLALWNPCTGRFRKLPTIPRELNIVHCDIKVYSTKSNTCRVFGVVV